MLVDMPRHHVRRQDHLLTTSPLEATPSYSELLRAACDRQPAQAARWRLVCASDTGDSWINARRTGSVSPRQGWKLHVSGSAWSAADTLRCVVPILLDQADAFKVAASRRALVALNNGDAGLSQVGKFITVYPSDDHQAVRLARALDAATRHLRGPRIPSDRRLRPGSCVWYRYGGFSSHHLQTPVGEILPAMVDPNGDLVPDQRMAHYAAPAWAHDPFEAAGLGTDAPDQRLLIGRRYLLGAMLHRAPRGAVFVAADLVEGRRVVLKQASSDALVAPDGHDARDRLRHEAQVLHALASAPDGNPFPGVYELVEDGQDVYLVLEDIVGLPLGAAVHARFARGQPLTIAEVIDWGRQLAQSLTLIHNRGYVYRDLKSGNVVVAADGRLRLLDFELAHACGSARRPYGRGTPGYMSPQQAGAMPPTPLDDVYALGAVLYLLLTGVEPSRAPQPAHLLSRPISGLNPECGVELADLVARCLAHDAEARPVSAAAVDAALATAIGASASASVPLKTDQTGKWRQQARQLGDSLCAAAQSVPGQPGLAWLSKLPGGLEIPCRDVNLGAAGIVLSLAELVDTFQDERHRAVLSEAARWLEAAPPPPGFHVPGLYVGEAGVGAALLRAGLVLGDQQLIDAAAARGRLVASLPHGSLDLFNGTAGRLRFHLLLWDATGESTHLVDARRAAFELLEQAQVEPHGGLFWVAPPGFERMSGRAFVGYAHGTAGIADALLDVFEATGDERYLEAAARAGEWVAGAAVSSLVDGSGLDWPVCAGEAEGQGFWCHGAAGVARFFVHAAALDAIGNAAELAAGGARTVVRATRWASPCQCHGLSGNLELLLDMYQFTGQHAYLDQAHELAALLGAFAIRHGDRLEWLMDGAEHASTDFLGGYAGVAACLLRLIQPEQRPTLLSRAGFTFRAARDPDRQN